MKKIIPIIRERERNEKKNIPRIWEPEGDEKKHSHDSGMGIRGFHSWEWKRAGCPDQTTSNLLEFNLQLPYKYDDHHGRHGHHGH